jgi:hypothetical protein
MSYTYNIIFVNTAESENHLYVTIFGTLNSEHFFLQNQINGIVETQY